MAFHVVLLAVLRLTISLVLVCASSALVQFLIVDGVKIPCSHTRSPADIPFGKYGADYVCESTGAFLTFQFLWFLRKSYLYPGYPAG